MRDGHFLKTSCGSPNYAAPEVISGRLYAGPEVDVWSCGVILYALLCGSLPFDDENIPNLFKKIKGGIYTLPSHLSPGARDLIPRMLLVDPLKRITIPEIRQHPWFNVHLPRYLAVMQADPVNANAQLDNEILKEVERLGFQREFLLESLRMRQQNKATVAYHLLADNRRRMPSSAYLKEEMTEGGPPPNAAMAHRSSAMGGSRSASSLQPAPRLVVERRWRLGIGSRSHPGTIMQELYRALASCGVTWKKGGPYNVKCRALVSLKSPEFVSTGTLSRGNSGVVPDSAAAIAAAAAVGVAVEGIAMMTDDVLMGSPSATAAAAAGFGNGIIRMLEIKFECQLYKVRDGEYALDMQRLGGDLMQFMCLVTDVAAILRI